MIQPKFPGQVREYLTKLRMESFLEIKPGYVDSGAAEGKNTAWTDPAQLKPETVTKSEVPNRRGSAECWVSCRFQAHTPKTRQISQASKRA